jgi:hypothetical protein
MLLRKLPKCRKLNKEKLNYMTHKGTGENSVHCFSKSGLDVCPLSQHEPRMFELR